MGASAPRSPTACGRTWPAVELLDTVPGISARSAEVLLAELGTDLSRFPTPSTWPPGRGCARATPRAAASA